MKVRIIKLNPEFLIDALQGKAISCVSNLPPKVELLDIKYDPFSRQVSAVIRSDNFEDVAETLPIPELNVVCSAASKVQLKTTGGSKVAPEPSQKTSVRIRQDTSAIENEFNRHQRDLLSFSVEGNCVIVKSNQYLKADWNEINEIVKSLGGKWVKGDILSYWTIPIQQEYP